MQFRTHEDSISFKEIVERVQGVFGEKSDLVEHFSQFVIGEKRNEKISGLVDAANTLPSLNVQPIGVELNTIIDHHQSSMISDRFDSDITSDPAATVVKNSVTSPIRKYEFAGKEAGGEVTTAEQTLKSDSSLVRSSTAAATSDHASSMPNTTIPPSMVAGCRLSVAQSSLNSGHSPRVMSSIQHRPPPPPMFPPHSSVVVDAGGSIMRPIYSPHAPPMIPQPLSAGFRTFNGYPGPQPPPINQYAGGGGSRRPPVPPPPHHNNNLNNNHNNHNNSNNSVPREPYGGNYRNVTPTNAGPGRRGGGSRTPGNFTALQSALYHNIATNSANSGPSPPPSQTASSLIEANSKTQPPLSKRPYNYVSAPNNDPTAAAGGGNSVSSSPIPPAAAGPSTSNNNIGQPNAYYSKCAPNIILPSPNNNPTNNIKNNNNIPAQFIPDTNNERYSHHNQQHPNTYMGTEYFESFDRGAFDFVSAVKMYFTDVLKKPRLYQDFVHYLREYQTQHEMIECGGPPLTAEDKKINEHELLKQLMDNVSELFNQNVELINSFLHYLPSLNSNLSAATLAPYHASLLNKQTPSSTGGVFAPIAHHNQQQQQQSAANHNEPNKVGRPRILSSHNNAGKAATLVNSDLGKRYNPSSVPMPTNSNQKAINRTTGNSIQTMPPHMATSANKYPPTSTNIPSSSMAPGAAHSTNNVNSNAAAAAAVARGAIPFMPHVNKQGAKPPTTANTSIATTAMATVGNLRQLPQSRIRMPYSSSTNINNRKVNISAHFDSSVVLQIFTEIRAVTNVKDYTNILKCINLYNLNVLTFTEFLCVIKSITFKNKIAYSKLRLILKNMAELSLEFDAVFPEIIYPGSEMPMKNRTAYNRPANLMSNTTANNMINNSNMINNNNQANIINNTTAGNNQLLMRGHTIVNQHGNRVVISRNTPNRISTAINPIPANASYFPVANPPSNLNVNVSTRYNAAVATASVNVGGAGYKSNVQLPRTHRIFAQNHIVGNAALISNNNNRVQLNNIIPLSKYVMKTSRKKNTFMESLSATQHARFYLDRDSRISSSYFLLGPSTPKWPCSGATALANSVVNSVCLSEAHTALEERTTNTTPAAFIRNIHEEELTRVEEERFELDVLLELLIHVRDHFRGLLVNEKAPTRENIFGNGMKFFIYKAVQNLYGDNCQKVITSLKLDPLSSLRVVMPRLEQKVKEWNVSKLHLEEYWRKVTSKNYLKALDYHFLAFKSADIKRMKAKQFIREIEQLSSNQADCVNKHNKPHLTINYSNKITISNATHLIMYHTKRQNALSPEDKVYIDRLVMNNFLPKFFNPADKDVVDRMSKKININNGGGDKGESFHFYASDDIYVFFRLHNLLCERLHKIYAICGDVIRVCELYNCSPALFDSNPNLNLAASTNNTTSNSSLTECIYHYPFLLSKSIHHRFSSVHQPKSHQELYDFFIELVQELLDGNIDNEFFEDECRFMLGTQCYVVFTVDRLIQECVKFLNFMVFNPPSQNLIDLFVKLGPIVADRQQSAIHDIAKCEGYKREMNTIMKSHNYYFDMKFTANHFNSALAEVNNENKNYYICCKIFLYQPFHEGNTNKVKPQTPSSTSTSSAAPPNVTQKAAVVKQRTEEAAYTASAAPQANFVPSIQADSPLPPTTHKTNQNETTIANSKHELAALKGTSEAGNNYPRNVLNDSNFNGWKYYVTYFVRQANPTYEAKTDEDDYTMCLSSLTEELEFVRENHIFMVSNLRHSFRRLPKKASQIIGLIKHLYLHDPSCDSAVFDSTKLLAASTAPDAEDLSERNQTPNLVDGGNLDSTVATAAPKNTINDLFIFDNEAYVLEPLIFKLQYLRDSCYFLYNKYSLRKSLKYYNNSASSLPAGKYLESIVCKNRLPSPTNTTPLPAASDLTTTKPYIVPRTDQNSVENPPQSLSAPQGRL